jgi:hypothetical protein
MKCSRPFSDVGSVAIGALNARDADLAPLISRAAPTGGA